MEFLYWIKFLNKDKVLVVCAKIQCGGKHQELSCTGINFDWSQEMEGRLQIPQDYECTKLVLLLTENLNVFIDLYL